MQYNLTFLRHILILLCFLVSFSCNASANDKQPLSRSFGSLYLKMKTKEFTELTGVRPETCHECTVGELYAALNVDKLSKIFPPYYYKLEGWQQGIDVSFFSDKLYRIEGFSEIITIKQAIEKYSAIYGKSYEIEEWENGISWAVWEDNKTKISLGYVREKGDVYPLNQKTGTVFKIKIVDKETLKSLEDN